MLKSIYVTLFMTAAVGFAVLSGIQLAGGFELAWLGGLLATAPIGGFFAVLVLFRPTARTGARVPPIIAATGVGFGLAVYGYAISPEPPVLALVAGTVGFAGWLLYDLWYSHLDRPAMAIEVGRRLPDLTFEDSAGAPVAGERYRGAPVLFMFYRGNWCPFCMAQIRELAAQYRELADRGVRLVLVSPQPHDNSAALADRFDIPCDFLTDPGNRVARQLGIVHEGGLPAGLQALGYHSDTVFPTVIIADAGGTVIFADETDNYRVRPEPDTFLRVLDDAGVATRAIAV
jgi:peroxiredoxin